MVKLNEDRWWDRDFPALVEIVRRFDEDPTDLVYPHELGEAIGVTTEEAERALGALARAYLIDIQHAGREIAWATGVSGSAHQMTGMWPTPESAVQRLVDLIESRIATTTDPAELGELGELERSVRSMRRPILVELIGAFAGAIFTGAAGG